MNKICNQAERSSVYAHVVEDNKVQKYYVFTL